MSEAYYLLAQADSTPVVVARAPVPPQPGRQPSVLQTETAVNRRHAWRNRPDRRQDRVSADLVDIGLMFVKVFGWDKGESYFACTAIEAHVYQRVLLGPHREPVPRGDRDARAPAE
jgi:hypothetical protein